MTGTQALAEIHRAANGNRVYFTRHALLRMRQRQATHRCVIKALREATVATWSDADQSWLTIGGSDVDGDELDVACAIEDGVVVVTVK